jgi:hypothetical protein
MIGGARALPLAHLSVRVPWHDRAWDGTVCDDPINNADCLALRRIREDKDEQAEARVAGKAWSELSPADLPACLNERASFMAPFEVVRTASHPYAQISKGHGHFRPTEFRMPPYSASCIPFRWMLREGASEIAGELGLGYETELEDRADELIGFETIWVQQKRNQLVLLESFFSAIQPERSLAFFYAKRTPLSEDPRRVLVGVARVLDTGAPREYEYLGDGELKAVLWEWPVRHSLRSEFKDGFLLPYHELLRISDENPSMDLESCVAFAPEDHWTEFSYSSEHVSHDAAIGSLLECARAIRAAQSSVTGNWQAVLEWIDARLAEVWRLRGPYPGLGATLTAFGIPGGTLLAHELAASAGENEDPWPLFESWLEVAAKGKAGSARVGKTTLEKWRSLPTERRELLTLLSRFDLTPTQATRLYQPTEREKARIDVTDLDLIQNPYLLYEGDRFSIDPITVGTIDRGAFPDDAVRNGHPVPEPSALDDATDPRRVRAFVVSYLEARSADGHTLQPAKEVVQAIRDMAVSPACPVDADLMSLVESRFDPMAELTEMTDGSPAYQLRRLSECGALIRSAIERRLKGALARCRSRLGRVAGRRAPRSHRRGRGTGAGGEARGPRGARLVAGLRVDRSCRDREDDPPLDSGRGAGRGQRRCPPTRADGQGPRADDEGDRGGGADCRPVLAASRPLRPRDRYLPTLWRAEGGGGQDGRDRRVLDAHRGTAGGNPRLPEGCRAPDLGGRSQATATDRERSSVRRHRGASRP